MTVAWYGKHVSPRRFYTQAFEEAPMNITSFSRHNNRSRRTRSICFEVDSLECRALLSTVPTVTATAASALNMGMVDVHVTGKVTDPGAVLSPVLGFEIVSSIGRVVEISEAPLMVSTTNPSTGAYDFWIGLNPNLLSTAGGQKYTIDVVASDMHLNMGFAPALIPAFPAPPGIFMPLTAGTSPVVTPPSTPPNPPGHVDITHGIVFNETPTVAPPMITPPSTPPNPPGHMDLTHGIVFN
jgi:hypothetical protein